MEQTLTQSGTFDFSKEKIEKLTIKGDNIIIKGLNMNNLQNKSITITGNNNTLDSCFFNGNEGNQCIYIKGQYCRITNCLFENMENKGCIITVVIHKSKPSYCLIDNNNFRDCLKTFDNGAELIRIGDSKTSIYNSFSIIYNNFFSRCNREIELISIKSCSNIICYNKIIECQSGICLRHGRRNIVKYNYINGNHIKGCAGIRIIDKEHIIHNNTIEGIDSNNNPFRSAISIMCGEEKPKANGYFPVKHIYIANNDILACDVAFSIGVNNKRGKQVKPLKLSMEHNRVVKCLKMIDDNEKCLGSEKSFMDNQEIKKDVKINVYKAEDLVFTPTLIQDLYIKLKNNNEKKDDEEEEEEVKEVKKDTFKFNDILEKIDDIIEENVNTDECIRCNDYIKQMEVMNKKSNLKIDKLTKENEKLKEFYNKVKEKFD